MFDSGMPEAMWVLQVEKFGPLTIAIDSHENNLFEEIRKKTEESRIKVYERLNIRFTV
jgi:tartrate dehydratase beta subunit/fumarate hydratase class I family protein